MRKTRKKGNRGEEWEESVNGEGIEVEGGRMSNEKQTIGGEEGGKEQVMGEGEEEREGQRKQRRRNRRGRRRSMRMGTEKKMEEEEEEK